MVNLWNENMNNKKTLEVLDYNIRENYDINIKNQIETVVCVMDGIYQQAVDGLITLENAKILSANMLRNARYGKDGYFWADTLEGVNVVLYGSPVEGTNRIDYQDERGVYVVRETILKALDGGGYYDYFFSKKGESKGQQKRDRKSVV